jgi:hypothetical protein
MATPKMHYLTGIPPAIPAGQVLVHNRVRPQPRAGLNGFRFWLQAPEAKLEPCDCGWAPGLEKHYRVKLRWRHL